MRAPSDAAAHLVHSLPEWNEQYVRFAEFEKLAAEGSLPVDKFFSELTKELNRVEAFRRAKEAELLKTQQSIEGVNPKHLKGKTRASMAVRPCTRSPCC